MRGICQGENPETQEIKAYESGKEISCEEEPVR